MEGETVRLASWALRKRWRTLGLILAVAGPGIITANVDNDAGGIATYSLAGGNYGLATLWALLPVGVLLFIIQEMCSRMGAVSGKGLADLIRERFGLKITFWLLMGLLITNLANTMAEFAGVASSSEILARTMAELWGASDPVTVAARVRVAAVPLAGLLVWWIVVRGNYKTVEKVFLVACLVYLAYPISGILARPDWSQVAGALVPQWSPEPGYGVMLVAIVGTTIAPWMQFYQQAAVVDKGITAEQYRLTTLDVLVGCVAAVVVVFFILMTCWSTIHASGLRVGSIDQAAEALRPLAGIHCQSLFAFGLLNASLFAASILPLSTAYTVTEGIGWERGLDRKFSEAPEFYLIYTALIAIGVGTVLWPNAPLLPIMYISQVLNGLLLPVVLVCMVILANDKRIMRERTNSRTYNFLSWFCVIAVSGLAFYLALQALLPGVFGR
jgi:Mn2+/Fe2+ NRAMP family transporter